MRHTRIWSGLLVAAALAGLAASAHPASDNEKASRLVMDSVRRHGSRNVPDSLLTGSGSLGHVSRADEFYLVSSRDTRSGVDIFSSLWGGVDRTQPADFRAARNRALQPVAFSLPDFFTTNRSLDKINRVFESISSEFPADLIKAIAWTESRWFHADPKGNIVAGVNFKKNGLGDPLRDPHTGRKLVDSVDWGIMQINDRKSTLNPREWDMQRIKLDVRYNIHAGIAVLRRKLQMVRNLRGQANWPQLEAKYRLAGYSDLEIAVKAYNGLQPSNRYVDQVLYALKVKPWRKGLHEGSAGGETSGSE